jgi:hypothetical protein
MLELPGVLVVEDDAAVMSKHSSVLESELAE